MKKIIAVTTVAILAATGTFIFAQSSDRPDDQAHRGKGHRMGHPGGRHQGPPDPILAVFDVDGDERISPEEIANASSVLVGFDSDGDGSLVHEELPKPDRPDGPKGSGKGQGSAGCGCDRGTGSREGGEKACLGSEEASVALIDRDLSVESGTVQMQNGFETDSRDGGRPVGLIAAALGVGDQVFRDAFSDVRPSRSGPPSSSAAAANKKILMDALSPHGVTNDRLDEVSNFYRYRPESGERWNHRKAKISAIIEDGTVTGFKVVDPGYGYLSEPIVSVAGYPNVRAQAKIAMDEDLRKNGRVESIELIESNESIKAAVDSETL